MRALLLGWCPIERTLRWQSHRAPGQAQYLDQGEMRPATITSVSAAGDRATLLYDPAPIRGFRDGEGVHERGVGRERLFPREAASQGGGQRSLPGALKLAEILDGEEADEEHRAWEAGDRVSVDYRGRGLFYRGEVAKKSGHDVYHIRYDDGDQEFDVPGERIQSPERGVIGI